MKRPEWVAVLLGCVVVAHGAVAQTTGPSLRTNLDTAVITVGDRIHLAVEVTHTGEQRVAWPDSFRLAPFEILDARVSTPIREGDRVRSSLILTLTAFELGDLEVPSFDVAIEGESADTLSTDSWLVTVQSVGLDEGGSIRDLKGPVAMTRNWLLLWPWVVGATVLGVVGWWAYRRYLRRAGPVAPSPALRGRLPHETALEALTALERSGLLQRGEYKEYYIRASDILRLYIHGRFGVDAMEMVTDEVVADLKSLPLEGNLVTTARTFLEACDLVKFAKHTPGPEASGEVIPAARQLIEATSPVSRPVEVGAG